MNLKLSRTGIAGLALLILGSLAAGAGARAQDAQEGSGQAARAVRLSYVDGQVQLSQGGEVLSGQAAANTPLFEGAQLTTADDGKAEIQFEDGSVARLAPDSSLTLTVLRGAGASADAEMTLNNGLAYFEFQGGGQAGQMSVNFGSNVAATNGFTALRVDMDRPPGSVAVFSGNVHLEIADGSSGIPIEADLHDGESIMLNGADPTEYDLSDSIAPNSWDTWNSDRDEALTAEAADQTAAPADVGQSDNPAWNDLDANGSWYNVPGQGDVWSPYEAQNPGFDPYGNGDWIDTPSYGYVWTSGYPWGYLPFQYGTWNYYGGFGWGWSPGAGNPWWNRGSYGGPNIGFAPHGYQPVRRPMPPRNAIGHRPMPMVAVNRRTLLANRTLPARDSSMPVTIAGSTVQAFRPLPSRPVYAQGFASTGNHPMPGVTRPAAGGGQGFPHPGYLSQRSAGITIMRPNYTPRPMPANRGFAPSYAPARSYTNSRSWNRGSSSSNSGRSSSSSGGGFHGSSGGSHGGGGGGFHGGGGGGFHSGGGGGGFHGGGGGGSYGGGGGGGHH